MLNLTKSDMEDLHYVIEFINDYLAEFDEFGYCVDCGTSDRSKNHDETCVFKRAARLANILEKANSDSEGEG